MRISDWSSDVCSSDLKWLSFPILAICFALICWFWVNLRKETAPCEDRSLIRASITGPEGSTFEYMDRFMLEMIRLVNDSVPEKAVNMVNTSPGWGGGGANSGRMRIGLVPPENRERSQEEIVEALTRQNGRFTEARTFISQQPTISVGRRGGSPTKTSSRAAIVTMLRRNTERTRTVW